MIVKYINSEQILLFLAVVCNMEMFTFAEFLFLIFKLLNPTASPYIIFIPSITTIVKFPFSIVYHGFLGWILKILMPSSLEPSDPHTCKSLEHNEL